MFLPSRVCDGQRKGDSIHDDERSLENEQSVTFLKRGRWLKNINYKMRSKYVRVEQKSTYKHVYIESK